MKRISYLFLVLLFVGCSKKIDSVDDYNPLRVNVSRGDFASDDSVKSKAVEVAFQSGDAIGVYIHTSAAVAAGGNHSSNLDYITIDGTTWQAAGSVGASFNSGTTYYASAYSPYKGNIANPHAVVHSVGYDQSAPLGSKATALELSDFMISAPSAIVVGSASAASVGLSFKHVLSKLVVSIDVPDMIDGVSVVELEKVVVKSVNRACEINVSTPDAAVGTLSDKGDISARCTNNSKVAGSVSTWEAIVVPQKVVGKAKLIEFVFKVVGNSTSSLNYYVPEGGLNFVQGEKKTLTVVSNADLGFVSALTLIDGEAKTGLPLTIKVGSGRSWALTTDVDWLSFATTTDGVYSKTITGVGASTNITVYAKVTANSASPYEPRPAILLLTDGKTASATIKTTQNYIKFEPVVVAWSVSAGSGQSSALGAFNTNQVWSAYFANNSNGWVSLNSSSTAGSGTLPLPHKTIGSLAANSLWLQTTTPNNTDAAKTETLKFGIDGSAIAVKELTITQAAPTLTLSANQNVAPHITSAAFNVIAPANYWGVTYTPKVGTNAISVSPATAVTIPSAAAYSGAVTVGFAANTTDAARAVTAIVGYGATKTATFTVTQALAALSINPASASATADQTSSTTALTTNVPYTSTYSPGCSSAQGVGSASTTVTFNYPAQPAAPSAARTHSMTITPNPANATTAIARTFTVSQAARTVNFSMSPLAPGETVPKAGKSYTTTITTNASWSVTSSSNATTSISGATLTITVGANSASSTRALSATVTTSNAAGQNNLSATWSGTQEASGPPVVEIAGTNWLMTNLTGSYQGQTSGFTVCANPQDYGMFWKWGSKYMYARESNGNPSGHWGSYTTWAATAPTAQSKGYDYGSSSLASSFGAPVGDPCQSLGAAYKTPTSAQLKALYDTGRSIYTSYKGVKGYFFGPSASSCSDQNLISGCIFLPCAGYRDWSNGSLYYETTIGWYWSSSVYNADNGWDLSFNYNGGIGPEYYDVRGLGFSVRCVQE